MLVANKDVVSYPPAARQVFVRVFNIVGFPSTSPLSLCLSAAFYNCRPFWSTYGRVRNNVGRQTKWKFGRAVDPPISWPDHCRR